MVHYRHKNRMLTTIVTLIVALVCFDLFVFLDGVFSLETNLLIAFSAGILLLALYHLYLYDHSHEHLTMINNLTQVYFAGILLISILLMTLMRALFDVAITTSYITLSIIVILAVLLTIGPYDRMLEAHLERKFPMRAPKRKR